MIRSVNGAAGTGSTAKREDLAVAGKTGTAQAQLLSLPQRDESGRTIKDAGNRPIRYRLEPLGTHASPNPLAPWYRAAGNEENGCSHSWFIGFAPAERPQIAFAVMVEYGGSGGTAAGGVAKRLLDACIKHGYLSPDTNVAHTP
jgi:cell division protein FtsI/penicillin-binding protein 2